MKRKLLSLTSTLVLLLVTAFGLSQPALKPSFTVTMEGDTCSYDGPMTITAEQARFNFVWNVDATRDMYGLAFATLEDQPRAALEAWTAPLETPAGLRLITFLDTTPDSHSIRTLYMYRNLEKGATLYIACFTRFPEKQVGVLGPIEVKAKVNVQP